MGRIYGILLLILTKRHLFTTAAGGLGFVKRFATQNFITSPFNIMALPHSALDSQTCTQNSQKRNHHTTFDISHSYTCTTDFASGGLLSLGSQSPLCRTHQERVWSPRDSRPSLRARSEGQGLKDRERQNLYTRFHSNKWRPPVRVCAAAHYTR